MTRRDVAEQWDIFQRSCGVLLLPPGARKLVRRAYYAGAWMVTDAASKAMSPGRDETEADIAVAQSIVDELREFGDDVKAGRA
jgi:hypothetical protein